MQLCLLSSNTVPLFYLLYRVRLRNDCMVGTQINIAAFQVFQSFPYSSVSLLSSAVCVSCWAEIHSGLEEALNSHKKLPVQPLLTGFHSYQHTTSFYSVCSSLDHSSSVSFSLAFIECGRNFECSTFTDTNWHFLISMLVKSRCGSLSDQKCWVLF